MHNFQFIASSLGTLKADQEKGNLAFITNFTCDKSSNLMVFFFSNKLQFQMLK